MRKLFFLFLILNCGFLYSQSDSLQIKRREEIKKRFDEQCGKDQNRAVEDSKTKTIFYINVPAPDGEEFLQEKEFAEILKPYEITFGGTWMGSDLAGSYSENQCYYSYMSKIAEDKFGKKFFEDKINEALRIFIKSNPNRIFDYRREELKFSEKNFEMDFWKKFTLPKNYIKRRENEDFSKIYIFFTIDNNGKADDVDFETEFINITNKKFETQILSSLKRKILKYKWEPNTYKGFPVKSSNYLSITFP